MIHISKLGRGKRLSSVEEAINVGDHLLVEIDSIETDNMGRTKVSLKPVGEGWDEPEGGWPRVEGDDGGERREYRDRGDRGRDRDRGPRRSRDRGDRGDRGARERRDA
jgi:polyribonucleotide nucleotidyltransferase